MAKLRHLGQLLFSMEHHISADGGPIVLKSLLSRFWRRGDSTNVAISMLHFKTGRKYQYDRYELDASRSNITDTINHGIELLCVCYEQEEFLLYSQILRSKTRRSTGSTKTTKSSRWLTGLQKAKAANAGRKEAKESIKIVVLDTHQYNELFSKYNDLYGKDIGSSRNKNRILKEKDFATSFKVLHGNGFSSKPAEVLIVALNNEWHLSDILQVLALGRKRIILVEMGEGVGKRLVDKGESSTSIRLSNLVLENS